MSLKNRSIWWKVGNSLWIFPSFIVFLNWMGILYVGIRVKNKHWIIAGIIYLLSVVSVFMTEVFSLPESSFRDSVIGFYVMTWLFSMLHSFLIRTKYLISLDALQSEKNPQIQENMMEKISPQRSEFMQKLDKMEQEILAKINKSEALSVSFVKDLKPMISKYLEQAEGLESQQQKLEKVVENYSVRKINKEIASLRMKYKKTSNANLADQYLDAINQKEKYKESLKELIEQKELIALRLNSIEINLEQVKFDLMRMEELNTEEERDRLFKSFEDKSNDLSEYINVLNDSYDENELE